MILQGILHKFTTYVNTSLSCRVSDFATVFVFNYMNNKFRRVHFSKNFLNMYPS